MKKPRSDEFSNRALGKGTLKRQTGVNAFGMGFLAALHTCCTVLAVELENFESSLFSGAGNCAFCHDPWNTEGAGQPGAAAVLSTDWRATMMAHAFKDPLWRAVMATEVAQRPKLKSFIENKCQTCHAPIARYQSHLNGTSELAFTEAAGSPLAAEGVGCTLCHQIQPENLGKAESFTGHFRIDTNREIFGPYHDVFTMPMRRHVNYTPRFGAHTQNSTLCAACHTLFTPIIDEAGKVVGQFPEQVPYLEWRNSDFARNGQHCQDCHMPRQDTAVKISARPPWLEARSPFWKHQFVGGNSFMLQVFADNADQLDAQATKTQLESMAEMARAQLRRAVQLEVSGRRDDDAVELRVEVENLSGHKFPSGHPYRRAWLHVRISDTRNRTLFESGDTDKSGALRGVSDGYAPHYDVITSPKEIQIYQSVMADLQEKTTWSLLDGASYRKDNRLPPRGFDPSEADSSNIAIRGAAAFDSNFHAQGSGKDTVTYRIAIPKGNGALGVEVEMLYQAVPPEAVAHVLKSKEPAAKRFAKLYRQQKNRPELVQRCELEL